MITVTEATAPAGALQRLADQGVSVWLDDLSRRRIESGNLAELIRTKHVVGVTPPPARVHAPQLASESDEEPLTDP
ncbi:transaldolase, partial [Streptomyces sp. NPDC059409]